MKVPKLEITTEEFIENLTFEYFETYSLLRGEEFKLLEVEYGNLEGKDNLNQNEIERVAELEKYFEFTQYLVDENGVLHFSSKKINTFFNYSNEAIELKDILALPAINIIDWICAPVYRDAILFYDSAHKIVACLNVCLSCEKLETDKFNLIADQEVFRRFRKFFENSGHEVENE